MGVAGPGNILSAGAVLQCQNGAGNHLSSVWPNDVAAQDLVGILLNQEFDQTFGIVVGLRTGVGQEGEFANLVLDSGGFQFLFVLADPSDFRVGIDDRGNRIVVDVAVSGVDVLDSSDTWRGRRGTIVRYQQHIERELPKPYLLPRPCVQAWDRT